MGIANILSWIVCGLIVGAVARFLVPGRQYMTLIQTTLLGIVGALIGGFIYAAVRGADVAPFSLTGHNWYGWIVSVLGAALLLWIYPFFFPRKWWA